MLNLARFALAAFAALVVLLALNMFVFPLVFPAGVASKFVNMRSESIVVLHIAAFVANAVLLTLLVVLMRSGTPGWHAVGVGGLAGLLASLPSAFHTQALADLSVSAEVVPVIWTTVTWSVATVVADWAFRWRKVRGV